MVEARLSALSGDARRVLRAASVFGEVCWESGALALLRGGMGASALREQLEALETQELLSWREESRFPGEREVVFRHALLRDGAYAMLTEDDGRLAHKAAGEWLSKHGEGDPMTLAGHFERGGDSPRAADLYLRAAEQASQAGDPGAAIARAKLGLACEVPEARRIALLGVLC